MLGLLNKVFTKVISCQHYWLSWSRTTHVTCMYTGIAEVTGQKIFRKLVSGCAYAQAKTSRVFFFLAKKSLISITVIIVFHVLIEKKEANKQT